MSTTRRKNHRFPRIFKGHRERIRHHEKCGTLPDIKPYLRAILFPGSFALPHLPKSSNIRFGIITQFPFCRHVQLLSTWNLSPLRSSKFSFKYLLLPPRSTPEAASRLPRLSNRRGRPLAWMAENRCDAWALSIFKAGCFRRWVVTHSLAGYHYHGYHPAVYSHQNLLWGLRSIDLGTLTPRSVHHTSPVLLTKNGPLGIHIPSLASFWQVGNLINLKFENRLGSLWS